MVPTKPLAFGALVSPEFRLGVYDVCDNLHWFESQASDLMSVMAFETGRRFSASVRNPGSSATGLLQFMSYTAKGLGTTTAKLAKMSNVEQLYYVEKYFRPSASRITSIEDMYMAVLWPKAMGKALDYILWRTGTRAYLVNKGLDLNRNGVITKREAAYKVIEQRKLGLLPENAWYPNARKV